MTRPAAPIRVISDGRAGIEAPALGLAEAVAERTGMTFDRQTIQWPPNLKMLESVLPYALFNVLMPPVSNPLPRLAIGSGRLAAPVLRQLSQRGVTSVFLGDPRVDPKYFDLVIAPAHDGLSGPNVMVTLGSLHRVSPGRLKAAKSEWAPVLEPLPHPAIAVLIGGNSKRHSLSVPTAQTIATQLVALVNGGAGLMVTISRRTPPDAREVFVRALGAMANVHLFDGTGANPYFGYLAHCDAIIVTNDSVNMASEAVATGKPVMVISLPGNDGKLARFHANLAQGNLTRPFSDPLDLWTPPGDGNDDMERAICRVTEMLEGKAQTAYL